MHVVDAEEVHVLYMPAEKRLPHAKIGHRRGDSRDPWHVVLREQAPQVPDVPALYLLIKEADRCVCAVEGRVQGDRAPEGPLQKIVLPVACRACKTASGLRDLASGQLSPIILMLPWHVLRKYCMTA